MFKWLFKRKSKEDEDSVAGYLTGYLYQNHVTFDYEIPECWEIFKTTYRDNFSKLLESIDVDADNVDFHLEHVEHEYVKTLKMLETQHQHNANIINKATNRRPADLDKAKRELEEQKKHLTKLNEARDELVNLRRYKNGNNYGYY